MGKERARASWSSMGGTPQWAVGYARVSTAQQGESGLGLEGQRASIRAFADSMGWRLIEICEDVHTGVGADSFGKRDGLRHALRLAREHGAYIITDSWSRLTRHAETGSEIKRAISDPDHLISVQAGNSFADAARAGQFARAEVEAKEISRRTMEDMAHRKSKGVVFGNPRILDAQVKGARAVADRADALAGRIADVLRAQKDHHSDLTKKQVVDLLTALPCSRHKARYGLPLAFVSRWSVPG